VLLGVSAVLIAVLRDKSISVIFADGALLFFALYTMVLPFLDKNEMMGAREVFSADSKDFYSKFWRLIYFIVGSVGYIVTIFRLIK